MTVPRQEKRQIDRKENPDFREIGGEILTIPGKEN